MSIIPIYSPRIVQEARLHGITELQAWRKVNTRELLLRKSPRPILTARRLPVLTPERQGGIIEG